MKKLVYGRLEYGSWEEYDDLSSVKIIDVIEGTYKTIVQVESLK